MIKKIAVSLLVVGIAAGIALSQDKMADKMAGKMADKKMAGGKMLSAMFMEDRQLGGRF